MKERLKVLSIGAGAIGTYIGGSLALHGHKVVFVERQAVAENIRADGLRLSLGGTDHHIPDPSVTNTIESALDRDTFDIALFALKSFDTPTFLNSLPKDVTKYPPFLCLSNGVDNEPTLADALGSTRVIAGTVTSAIGRRGSGNIILERLRGVGVAGGNPLSRQLVDAFEGAGLNARLFSTAADMKWSKMLTNLIANASSAILDMPPAEIFSDPGLFRLEIHQLREALAVMKAQGINVVDLPGTPVGLLAFAIRYLPLSISRPLLAKAVGGGRGGKMPSFHIDLYGGRKKSEVDYLNGAVVRGGNRLNIPTPANQLLNEILLGLTAGEIPMGTYNQQPEVLLKMYAEI